MSYENSKRCPRCWGSGQARKVVQGVPTDDMIKCPRCAGEGRVPFESDLLEQYRSAVGATQSLGEPRGLGEDYQDLDRCEHCQGYELHRYAFIRSGMDDLFGTPHLVHRYESTCLGCDHVCAIYRISL